MEKNYCQRDGGVWNEPCLVVHTIDSDLSVIMLTGYNEAGKQNKAGKSFLIAHADELEDI